MAPQAIADPEDLERFARDLNAFSTSLRDSVRRINASFARVGETWRDQEHAKFAHEYEQTVRVLEHFLSVAEEHAPFLMRKAQKVRDYLGQG